MARHFIAKTFRFEAAHYLPNVEPGHQCRRIHGHSYKVEVAVSGPLDPEYGWVIDFGELSRMWQSEFGAWDHSLLNEQVSNPTAEHLASRVGTILASHLGLLHPAVNIEWVRVEETETSSAVWMP